jgi:tartrate dehydratase alpha subunit/fumarate hydratase class I-like protein
MKAKGHEQSIARYRTRVAGSASSKYSAIHTALLDSATLNEATEVKMCQDAGSIVVITTEPQELLGNR